MEVVDRWGEKIVCWGSKVFESVIYEGIFRL